MATVNISDASLRLLTEEKAKTRESLGSLADLAIKGLILARRKSRSEARRVVSETQGSSQG